MKLKAEVKELKQSLDNAEQHHHHHRHKEGEPKRKHNHDDMEDEEKLLLRNCLPSKKAKNDRSEQMV